MPEIASGIHNTSADQEVIHNATIRFDNARHATAHARTKVTPVTNEQAR